MIEPQQIRHAIREWLVSLPYPPKTGEWPGIHVDAIAPTAIASIHLAVAASAFDAACGILRDEHIDAVPALLVRLDPDKPLDVERVRGLESLAELMHLPMPPEVNLVYQRDELRIITEGTLLPHFRHSRPVHAFLCSWVDQWDDTVRDVWMIPDAAVESPTR